MNSSTAPTLPEPFMDIELPLADRRAGKVRVSYALAPSDDGTGRRLFVTTDRLSAFDRIIAGIPYKGQVLNELAAWWFARTSSIIGNHVLDVPDPNVLVATDTTPLPVEVVVRGAITGVTSTSLWRMYEDGARTMYGYHFPDGLRKNTLLPEPIVTPTTKPSAESGLHDEPVTWADVVDRGLVEGSMWEQVTSAAIDLFAEGKRIAADAGLILADTKYEFGVTPDGPDGNRVLLIDEVHTPDSSRFWVAESYEARLAADQEPESLDKEPMRLALSEAGYRGDGPPPDLDPAVIAATTGRYISAYERLTGQSLRLGAYPVDERISADLDRLTGDGSNHPASPHHESPHQESTEPA